MKKFFSFLAIIAIISASNCSRIAENNDPVIGIWTHTPVASGGEVQKASSIKEEWIFNDVYLGRYHKIENNTITLKSDFGWSEEKGVYTISYPGLDRKDDQVILKESGESAILEDMKGNPFAKRE